MTTTWRNTGSTPIDWPDGTVLGAGEDHDLDVLTPDLERQVHVGNLTLVGGPLADVPDAQRQDDSQPEQPEQVGPADPAEAGQDGQSAPDDPGA